MTYPRTGSDSKKFGLLVIVVILILSLIGGLVGGFLFAKPGPQGPQGIQGIQGEPGLNGTNAILQVLQNLNSTAVNVDAYGAAQWLNMSVFDSSMSLTVNVNAQSRILAEFVTSVYLTNAAVRFRIVVDNQYISAVSYTGLLGPNSPNDYDPVQVKFLTGALSAGQHTIDVQFYRDNGSPTVLDRSLFVTELLLP